MKNDAASQFALRALERNGYSRRLRPAALGSLLQRLTLPLDRRRIITLDSGLRLYLDPLSHLGEAILRRGEYEPTNSALISDNLSPGDVFLDVGANEGYFSALAGRRVSPGGMVIAVEPQSRLRDILEINLHINEISRFEVVTHALGGPAGAEAELNLWPASNTGASSLARRYRFSAASERVSFVSFDALLAKTPAGHVDLMKIDVEGFEHEIVTSILPRLREGAVRKLMIEYHSTILAANGHSREALQDAIVSAGFAAERAEEDGPTSWVFYRWKGDGAAGGR
jgi:FkbM family methyltransferase